MDGKREWLSHSLISNIPVWAIQNELPYLPPDSMTMALIKNDLMSKPILHNSPDSHTISMEFATKLMHAGIHPDPTTGAVMTPIFQTSTYAQTSPGVHKGYEYSRTHNPTRTVLQDNLAALEGGKFAMCYATGLAATDAVLKLLKPGDEVVASSDLYGGAPISFSKIRFEASKSFTAIPICSIFRILSC